jgi:hypothetical protein
MCVSFNLFLVAMEKDSIGYKKCPKVSEELSERVQVARNIEETRIALRNNLKSCSASCCKNNIIDLEERLAQLHHQEEGIEKKDEAKFLINNLSDYMKDGVLELSNTTLVTMRGLLAHDLKNITHLKLPRNKLELLPLGTIVDACPVLAHLDVKNNKIACMTYRDATYEIPQCTSLHTLLLPQNDLRDFDFDSCFYMFPNIKKLDISENEFNEYTWNNMFGWSHDNTETHPWPIINISGNQLNREELCAHYAAMSRKYYENAWLGGHGEQWRCNSGLMGLAVGLGGGLFGGVIAGAFTHNPFWIFAGFVPPFITTPLATKASCWLANVCARSSVAHDQRMQALTLSQNNIQDAMSGETAQEDDTVAIDLESAT